MEVLVSRVLTINNMHRGAANALSSFYIKTRCENHPRLAFRVNSVRPMVLSCRLGSFHTNSLLALSTSRSPFLLDTVPLFRPAFHCPMDTNSPATLPVGTHDVGRWYSAKPVTNEHLKPHDHHRQGKADEKITSLENRHEMSQTPADSLAKATADVDASKGRSEVSFTKTNTNNAETTRASLTDGATNDKTEKPEAQADTASNGAEETAPAAVEPVQNVSIMQRFKMMYKQYGIVLVGVHCLTVPFWAGLFYYAAVSGIDVVPVLRWMGVSETIISPFLLPNVGNIAVVYLLYKVATPVRYTVTMAGTQLAVRNLRKYGYLKQPETVDGKPDSLRLLMKDGKVKVKDRMEHIREDMHELKGKIDHIRDRSPASSSTDKQKR